MRYRITIKWRTGDEYIYHLIDEFSVYYDTNKSCNLIAMKRNNGFREYWRLDEEILSFSVEIEKREDI